MNFKSSFAFLAALSFSVSFALAAGPGGESGGGPGGESGGGPGGESGGGPGESGGGSGGSFTYDSFIGVTTNANCLIREGTLYGFTSSLTTTVRPTTAAVTALADGVFAGNTAITTVNLSSCTALAEIPDSAFAGCTALASVTLPSSVTTIGPNAFAGCTALSSFTGAGVATVGSDAFHGCTALASVPSTATTLCAYSFAGSGLTSVDASGRSLGEGAFAGCASLVALSGATELPAALCAGCTALDVSDWTAVSSFGQASLAGIPAETLAFSSSATLAAYALAADEAVVATTIEQDALPTYADTAFLGREVSYMPDDDTVTRIEAEALVNWLAAQAADETSAVAQPASYATADLETWLATQSNADAILAFCYEERFAADADFHPLDIDGTTFLWATPDAGTEASVTVTLVGATALDGEWSGDLLVADADADTATHAAFVAVKDGTEPDAAFARLHMGKAW